MVLGRINTPQSAKNLESKEIQGIIAIIENQILTRAEKLFYLSQFVDEANQAKAYITPDSVLLASLSRVNSMIAYLGSDKRIGTSLPVSRLSPKDKASLDAPWLPVLVGDEEPPLNELSLIACLMDTHPFKRPRLNSTWLVETKGREPHNSYAKVPKRSLFDYTKVFPARAPRPKL